MADSGPIVRAGWGTELIRRGGGGEVKILETKTFISRPFGPYLSLFVGKIQWDERKFSASSLKPLKTNLVTYLFLTKEVGLVCGLKTTPPF